LKVLEKFQAVKFYAKRLTMICICWPCTPRPWRRQRHFCPFGYRWSPLQDWSDGLAQGDTIPATDHGFVAMGRLCASCKNTCRPSARAENQVLL